MSYCATLKSILSCSRASVAGASKSESLARAFLWAKLHQPTMLQYRKNETLCPKDHNNNFPILYGLRYVREYFNILCSTQKALFHCCFVPYRFAHFHSNTNICKGNLTYAFCRQRFETLRMGTLFYFLRRASLKIDLTTTIYEKYKQRIEKTGMMRKCHLYLPQEEWTRSRRQTTNSWLFFKKRFARID